MAFSLSSIARIKSYYLKGILAIYIVAFTSLYVQVQSLFGDNGIVPLRDFISKPGTSKVSLDHAYNMVTVAPKIGLSYGTFIELLCILSVLLALAALLVRRFANALSFGLLWYIYYSICSVGQGFMSFHSDLLLLEVGFITILLAPLLPTSRISQSDHDHLSFFLIKWLTFRYFVTNVLNIYLDNDKAWYNMTAIPMVAQGVQFPSLFSWQIYNMPTEYVKLYQAYEHSVKLCAPFLFLFDLKFSRFLAFYTLLFVTVPSALFFNFGWTDLLISVCLASFLKDSYFYSDKRAKQSGLKTFLDIVVTMTYVGTVGFILVKFYGVRYENSILKTQVQFTPAQFKLFTDHLIPASLLLGILGLVSSAYTTYFSSPRKTSIIKTLAYTMIVTALFFSTFPTLTRFAPGLDSKIKPVAVAKDLSRFVAPYMLSNNYILLSKTSQHYAEGRPELQLQGRVSAEAPTWQQFDLRYKPGQPAKELNRVVPHLPRIDLKMWYAARSSLQNNQWIQTFAYRVATKENDVVNSISPMSVIPKVNQVRVVLHNYKYSSKAKQPFAGYWAQSKLVSEYMPTTNLENLKFNVKSSGINLVPAPKTSEDSKSNSIDQLLSKYLEISSKYIRGVDHTAVIWTLTAIAAVSMLSILYSNISDSNYKSKMSAVGKLILIGILAILSIALFRALFMYKPQPPPTACIDAPDHKRIELHSDPKIIDRFIGALNIPSISYNRHDYDGPQMLRMIEYIQKSYPTLHSSPLVTREIVSNYSLLYTIKGSNSKLRPYMLTSHLDVVPAVKSKWSSEPFEAIVRDDGYIYARGTMDAKHLVFGILEATEHLLKNNFKPGRTYYIAFGHDEEVLGEEGAQEIARILKGRIKDKMEYIIDEGLIISKTHFPGVPHDVGLIGVSEKGYLSLKVSTVGGIGHGSMPPSRTAISKLADVLSRFHSNILPSFIGQGVEREMFEVFAAHADWPMKIVYSNFWLFKPFIGYVFSQNPTLNALIRTTTAVTMVQGGTKENVLPDSASAIINHRLHQAQTIEEVIEFDRKLIGDPTIDIKINGPPTPADPVSPYCDDCYGYQLIKQSLLQVYPGTVVVPSIFLAATDSKWYKNLTDSIYRFSAIAVEMEEMKSFHGHDERLSVSNYESLVNFYHHLILNSDKANLKFKSNQRDEL